jgi:hypothetical protein
VFAIPYPENVQLNVSVYLYVGTFGQTAWMYLDSTALNVVPTWAEDELILQTIVGDYVHTIPTSVIGRAQQPGNTTPTSFYIDGVDIYIAAGTLVPESELNFSNSAKERVRSGDLANVLIDGHRYQVYAITVEQVGPDNLISGRSSDYLIYQVTGVTP